MKSYYQRGTSVNDPLCSESNQSFRSLTLKYIYLTILASFISWTVSAQNPIVTENALAGNPQSEWEVGNAGDPTIQGFATDISINKGTTVSFKINVTGTNKNYSIRIYRLGYYQGNGARLITNLGTFTGVTQPNPSVDLVTGLIDCGNWLESASWAVPSTAVSGIYIAKIIRSDNGGASHITFIVRDDAGTAPILFKTSDATWQAYNNYGGNSFYLGTTSNPEGRAHKISYNRPFSTRNIKPESFLFNAEYPMLRWLERNGYNMCYATDVDMERDQTLITPAKRKILLSVGHDEYWSAGQRNKFEAARNAGVHLAFFSGNEVYWKTRWENSTRTLVCYKEGATLGQGEFNCGGNCDPLPGVWTGLWRFGCEYAEDGCKPENALSGQISWTESSTAIKVPDTYKNLPFWRNTSIATLGAGQTATLTDFTLGYEWNYEQDAFASYNPPGRITMSSTTFNGKTHKLSLYTHSSGAIVFGAGTCQWSWGLDDVHDREKPLPTRDMQQATLNLLLDMGVSPGTPQSNLIISGSGTDQTAPVSIINAPVNGASVTANTVLNINGTSSDAGGVLRVEVSTNGGSTWQTATGTTSWNYNWTPASAGSYVILSRAVDNAGNVETPGTPPASNAKNITVTGGSSGTCPCSIFTNAPLPAISNQRDNTLGIVIGTRFRSSANGAVTAIRFYKGAGNTGTHIGQLWTSSGTLLAQATFTNETTSGWQQVTLPTPVNITSGVSYIVSYHSSQGYYSTTGDYFANSTTSGPLTAPADATGANNGVYKYSSVPVFPNETYGKENYFVDVVFNTGTITDLAPPAVNAVSPLSGATGVSISSAVTADFSESLDPSSVSGSTVFLSNGSTNVTANIAYNSTNNRITLTPVSALANGVTYTMTLKGPAGIKDLAGNTMVLDYTWTFTTVSGQVQTGNCPCTIFTNQLPDIANQRDNTIGIVLGTRFLSSVNGTVTAIRFYKGAGNTGTHIGQLWTSSGTLLGQATFANETTSGWQEVSLPSPVSITAGTHYIVSYYSSNGYYSTRNNFFASSVVNGPLTAPADATGANNGLYKYSASPVFPNETYQKESYYVDVVFNTGSSQDLIAPVVNTVSPVANATGVATGTAITAVFNEALNPASINTTSVLIQRGGTAVSASVAYNSGTNSITLTPSSALINNTVYTVTLKGGTGSTAIKDISGNALAADYTWSFTTAAVSVDVTAPTSTIVSPVNGANLTVNLPVTVSGTAVDAGGLNRIEVSVNGGSSWQTATGTANWTYTWTPATTGTILIKSRGIDNTGNIETAGSAIASNVISVNIVAASTNNCPCTIFSTAQSIQPTGAQFKNDGPALEIGTKFSTNQNGYITALRFYKAAGNTGTHTGRLYSLAGALLAQAVFTSETASGWQQVALSSPVAVTAGTVYIVSYHSSAGYYSTTNNYFTTAVVNGPLRGLADGENGGNGLYRYNATPVFPNGTYMSSNYWADVVFNTVAASAGQSAQEMKMTDAPSGNNLSNGLTNGKLIFYLAQNAPNPSSGKTIIRYSMPVKTHVSMALYDIQGRQIRVLVNEIKEAGEQRFELDTRPLSKGVYYYKMKADDFFSVKRLVVE